MPPRLNKRQQREVEELAALQLEDAVDNEDEVVEQMPSGFAALAAQQEEDSDAEGESPAEKSKFKKKKKKKKPAATTAVPISPVKSPPIPQAQPLKNEKKARKKAKKKEKDELDEALAELAGKYPELQAVEATTSQPAVSTSTFASLLSVSLQHLDADAELRKFFGSKVVQSSTPSASSSSKFSKLNKSNLTRPKPEWAGAGRSEGLSIRQLTPEELERKGNLKEAGETWWTITYSQKYKSVTKGFMRVVMSGDPNGFYELIRKSPWHADTLLQLSEVYRHREEHTSAQDFLSRALFTYERSFLGLFTFTSGVNRLDFDRVENRVFYLGIARSVVDLHRRGTLRTAFEFARLLYSLDPHTDPHGALLHLDGLWYKAGMGEWLLHLFDHFAKKNAPPPRMDPSLLPGWNYSRALAMRISKDPNEKEASTQALIDAIKAFPSVVPLLADKLDVSVSAEVRGRKEFRVEVDGSGLPEHLSILHLLSHLYAQRSSTMWKDKDHASWFASTVNANFPHSLPSKPPERREKCLELFKKAEILRYSVYRHVLLSTPTLMKFVPRALFSHSLSCDPLPPLTSVTSYSDPAFFEGVQDPQERLLRQIVPDEGNRRALEVMFEGNEVLRDMFGGDFARFVRELREMPELALGGALGDAGGMPGGFAAEEEIEEEIVVGRRRQNDDDGATDDDETGEEDSDEEEEYVTPLPVRMIRNVLSRFWGGNAPPPEDSSDDDAAGERREVRDDDVD